MRILLGVISALIAMSGPILGYILYCWLIRHVDCDIEAAGIDTTLSFMIITVGAIFTSLWSFGVFKDHNSQR